MSRLTDRWRKARRNFGESASKLFEKSPLAFSGLPAPFKRESYEQDLERARNAEQQLAEETAARQRDYEARTRAAREKVGSLFLQLVDVRTRGPDNQFPDADAASYRRRYLR